MKTSRQVEAKYRAALRNLAKSLSANTSRLIYPVLHSYASEYTNDSYASALQMSLAQLNSLYADIGREALTVSNSFVMGSNTVNKRKFYKALESAVGVDLKSVISGENLEDILVAKTQENVALIRSMPDEFLKKIETIVYEGTTQGSKPTSMIQQIRKAGKTTESRAKLIARDQSSKINSALNQQRQQNLGVEEYIWKTADDDRVRPDHASKNGKTFRWDKPPKDTGHPGEDIQCRCIAQAIIKI